MFGKASSFDDLYNGLVWDQKQLQILNSNLNSITKRIDILENTKPELKVDLKPINDEITTIKSQINQIENNIADINTKIEQLPKPNDIDTTKFVLQTDYDNYVTENRNIITELNSKIDGIDKRTIEIDNKVNSIAIPDMTGILDKLNEFETVKERVISIPAIVEEQKLAIDKIAITLNSLIDVLDEQSRVKLSNSSGEEWKKHLERHNTLKAIERLRVIEQYR